MTKHYLYELTLDGCDRKYYGVSKDPELRRKQHVSIIFDNATNGSFNRSMRENRTTESAVRLKVIRGYEDRVEAIEAEKQAILADPFCYNVQHGLLEPLLHKLELPAYDVRIRSPFLIYNKSIYVLIRLSANTYWCYMTTAISATLRPYGYNATKIYALVQQLRGYVEAEVVLTDNFTPSDKRKKTFVSAYSKALEIRDEKRTVFARDRDAIAYLIRLSLASGDHEPAPAMIYNYERFVEYYKQKKSA